jgi:hypothetical protein
MNKRRAFARSIRMREPIEKRECAQCAVVEKSRLNHPPLFCTASLSSVGVEKIVTLDFQLYPRSAARTRLNREAKKISFLRIIERAKYFNEPLDGLRLNERGIVPNQ